MTVIELKNLIARKLGVMIRDVHAENFKSFAVRFTYHGNTYRVNTDLFVEKVEGACLVSDSDARQLEKLLRGEQWDGTGLPPVGTECEFLSNDTTWGKVVIIGYDGDRVVFKPSGETYYGIEPSERQIFRPLRTERDKAIEQMLSTVTNYNNTSVIHAAGQIYDAIVAGKIDGLGKVG